MAGGIRATVETQLETMSPRDKRLLAGLITVLGFAAVFLLWYTLTGVLANRASHVVDAKDRLRLLQSMESEYQLAASRLASQESRVKSHASQPLTGFVESTAEELGVKEGLRNVNRTGTEEVSGIRKTEYKVELKGQEYDDLVKFLYKLEASGYPLQVKSAKFKKAFVKREPKVDLTLELIVFQLVEG